MLNDTDDPVDFSKGWLPPAPGAKPYPLRLADALDAFKAAQYTFDPNSADAARQRQRLAQVLEAYSGTESGQSPSSGFDQTSLLTNDPSWAASSPKAQAASVLQKIGASLTKTTGGGDDALRLGPSGSQLDNEMARTQYRIDELERQNNLLASQINAERVDAASANGEDLAPTLTNAARLGLYDTFAGGSPVPFTSASVSSGGPVDGMGQPLNGPSNYDSFQKLKDILTSTNGESLSPRRLWDWATYTSPNATQLRSDIGAEYGLLPNPRFVQIDQIAASPLGGAAFGVSNLLGASPATQQAGLNVGTALDGLLLTGAGLSGRVPAFTGAQSIIGRAGIPEVGAAPLEKEAPPSDGSLRLRYMGATPDKYSTTGSSVVERMRGEGRIIGNGPLLRGNPNRLQLVTGEGNLVDIDSKVDMAHKTDAVTWWNQSGRFFGEKAPEVRQFMLDPNNYELQPNSLNRAAGASLRETYLPPAPDFTDLKR